jgi:hypothetical protein
VLQLHAKVALVGALESVFIPENLRALSGFFVFTSRESSDLMELLQASVAARSGASSKLRTSSTGFLFARSSVWRQKTLRQASVTI